MTSFTGQNTNSCELPPPPKIPEGGLPDFVDPTTLQQQAPSREVPGVPASPNPDDTVILPPLPKPAETPAEDPATAKISPRQIEKATSFGELRAFYKEIEKRLDGLEAHYGEDLMRPWAKRWLHPSTLMYLYDNQPNEVFPLGATPNEFYGCAQAGLQYIIGNRPDLLPPKITQEINAGNEQVRQAITEELSEALSEADRYSGADGNKQRGLEANLNELTAAASEYQALADNRELIVLRANKLHGSEQKPRGGKIAPLLGKCALLALTVPVRTAKHLYETPAKIATYSAAAVQSRVASTMATHAHRLESKYGKTTRILNAAVAVGIVARIGFAFYRANYKAKHGIEIYGNSSAMYVVDKVNQYVSDSVRGNNSPILEAPSISLLDFETSAPAAANTSDIAPDAVTLGEWGGPDNPSQGTVWGETMKYLEQMGVDTKSLTTDEKGQIVGDMLNHNGLTWEQAAEMPSDAKVKLPSANAMEQIFDKHNIIHGEFKSIVEPSQTTAPDVGQKAGSGNAHDGQNPQDGDSPTTQSSAEASPAPSAKASPEASVSAAPITPVESHNTTMYYPPAGEELARAFMDSAVLVGASSLATGGLIASKEKASTGKSKKRRSSARRP